MGAYLTQNTSWGNVEIAMKCLRSARVLNVAGIRKLSLPKLERLIRSSGYFRQKARRLKTFINFLDRKYSGSLEEMFLQPTSKLREQLLSLNGVGPETADSILLCAGQHPTFVVDAYQEDWLPATASCQRTPPMKTFASSSNGRWLLLLRWLPLILSYHPEELRTDPRA